MGAVVTSEGSTLKSMGENSPDRGNQRVTEVESFEFNNLCMLEGKKTAPHVQLSAL